MKLLLILSMSIFTILFAGTIEKVHPSIKLINNAKIHTKAISPKELKEHIDDEDEDLVMLDIREILERSEGQIFTENAYAITRGNLELNVLHKIKNTDALVVTYCRAGIKAILAAQTLQWLGYKNVRYLDGGLRAWANAGYPIETGLGITRLSNELD